MSRVPDSLDRGREERMGVRSFLTPAAVTFTDDESKTLEHLSGAGGGGQG